MVKSIIQEIEARTRSSGFMDRVIDIESSVGKNFISIRNVKFIYTMPDK